MSFLDKIAERKRERLASVKGKVRLSDLRSRIGDIERSRDFEGAVRRGAGRIRLIAEIKKASPSQGIVRADFDLIGISRIYEEKAVDAVSVITEEDFFSGNLNYIPSVKQEVTRPVLRKDFIIDEYQVYESRAYGADAILLIAALLTVSQAKEYLHLSRELGLSVLFEVHDLRDLDKALTVDAGIIGINNRDLKTLAIDITTTFLLKRAMPPGRISVSESGIKTGEDVLRLEEAGVDAMLIGTSLMKSGDIGRKIDELRSRTQTLQFHGGQYEGNEGRTF
ncbi:MAG TPA: indole-3-glycerol phosphate synthase TrpC [Thermodesulfovibrionales bacterium]|nr:indole-3-glycerol phosphate synthase TrpC [Thermodesulfovibrionales bacterium]